MSADLPRYNFTQWATEATDAERRSGMLQGTAPDFSQLLGWEFAGLNTGAVTDVLRIRKFKKGFYQGPPRVAQGAEPFIQGYNVTVQQNGVHSPHVATPSEEHPKRHGFFRVHNVVSGSQDARYPNALLLDYGLGNNGANPAALLRDYLVQIYPDNPDLFLGHAFLSVLGARIHAGFFVLHRHNSHSFQG